MSFKDYQDVVDPLILPILGKKYTIPPIGWAEGVQLSRFQEAVAAGENPEPVSNEKFLTMVLGDAYDRMTEDNVPQGAVMRAAMTALADFERGREVAEIMWETGGDPKAVEATVKKLSTVAPTTPRRASGTTRKKTQTA